MENVVFYTTKQDGWSPVPFNPNDKDGITKYIRISDGKDTYKSINHFIEPTEKTQNNIGTLLSLILDVEIKNHLYIITLEDAKEILRHIEKDFDVLMPKPSAVVHSGRGLHIVFDIEESRDIQKYQIVLNRIRLICDEIMGKQNAFNEVKADTTVDYWSWIRVEGTYNTEAKTYSQRIYESKARYTLDNLIERYIDSLTDIIGEGLKQRAKTSKLHQVEFKTHKKIFRGYRKGFTAKTLQASVLSDLEKLQGLRATNIIKHKDKYIDKGHEGYRNLTLFVYAVYSKYYHEDTNTAYKALQRFNARFKPQPLDENELSAVFVSSLKSNYTTHKLSTIVERLELDPNEMKQMAVLFDSNEKKRRQKERVAEQTKRLTKGRQEAKIELIAQVKELKQSGLNASQIALKLNLSRPTVNKYLCQ